MKKLPEENAVVRSARTDDFRAIFLMGYDAWGGSAPVEAYLLECERSPKYALGGWYLLEVDARPTSALIRYRGAFGLPEGSWGVGSIATAPQWRRRGYAEHLIRAVLGFEEGPAFLHAEIDPAFYQRFGFVELPAHMQRRAGSTLMARGAPSGSFTPPSYF